MELPPAINLDNTLRIKQDPFDYGLTSNDAEEFEYRKQFEYYSQLSSYEKKKIKYAT